MIAAAAVALVPLGVGVGTALGAGNAVGGAVSAATGHSSPSGKANAPAATSQNASPHTTSPAGAGADDKHVAPHKDADNSSGSELSVVHNSKTNRVWVVSTDKKTGGMSVLGTAVVNGGAKPGGTGNKASAPPSSAGNTAAGAPNQAGNTAKGGDNKSSSTVNFVVNKTGNVASVVDSTSNKVVASVPLKPGSHQAFSAPNSLPTSQAPADIVGQPNGASH